MLLDTSLLDLISSIAQNGFFHGEPLLVVKRNGDFTVVEGNRRLAACLVLNAPTISKVKSKSIGEILNETNHRNVPSSLPCIVFDRKDEVVNYLGYRHVTGVKSWGPLSKARYLDMLFSNLKFRGALQKKCSLLAKKIGSKGGSVKKLLVGYWMYQILEEEGFFGIRELGEDKIDFSNLYSALRFAHIKKFLNVNLDVNQPIQSINKENFKEFCGWLYEKSEGATRLGDNRNLGTLDRIVQSNEALKAFRSGKTLEEASQYSDAPDEMLSYYIQKSLSNIQQAVTTYGRATSLSEGDLENINQIIKLASMVSNTAKN